MNQAGGGSPQINNSATVVFTAFAQSPTSSFTILTGNGGPLTIIDQDYYPPGPGGVYLPNRGASINDAGVVAYERGNNYDTYSTRGIYTSAGTTIYESISPNLNSSSFLPPSYPETSINNSGQVAFVKNIIGGGTELATGNGGPLITIKTITGGDGQVNPINPGALSDSGTVAFSAFDTSPSGFSIYMGSGGALTTIYSGGDVYEQQPDINNAGTVAFSHGQPHVVTGNGGPLTTVPDSSLYLSVDPSINNLGQVAYLGVDASLVVGIYLGASLNPLVKKGDSLDGSTIQYFVGGPSLNDHGQIAFSVLFEDGREGIWVANPVPEPSSMTLLTVGAVLGFGLQSTRKRSRASSHDKTAPSNETSL